MDPAERLKRAMAQMLKNHANSPATEYKFLRLCPKCRIRWMATMETRDCPKCKAGGFFTINAGDIGTCMYLESAGLSVADFEEWEAGDR